jgi:hypothetical protein
MQITSLVREIADLCRLNRLHLKRTMEKVVSNVASFNQIFLVYTSKTSGCWPSVILERYVSGCRVSSGDNLLH